MKSFNEIVNYLNETADQYYEGISLSSYRKCLKLLQTQLHYTAKELESLGIKPTSMARYGILIRTGECYRLAVHLDPADELIFTQSLKEIEAALSEYKIKQTQLYSKYNQLATQYQNILNQMVKQIDEELLPLKCKAQENIQKIREEIK